MYWQGQIEKEGGAKEPHPFAREVMIELKLCIVEPLKPFFSLVR